MDDVASACRYRRPTSRIALGALLSLWFLLTPAWAADVRGRITFPDGRPAANERILLGDTPIGKTDVAGVYWLNLPAGAHTLIVRDQQFGIQVSPNGSRFDIRLK